MENPAKSLYRCGTLTYIKPGLLTLAIWLLWGDFSSILLSNVFPALTQPQLNLHNAGNAAIGFLMGAIPAVITFIFNPVISTCSDHTRKPSGKTDSLSAFYGSFPDTVHDFPRLERPDGIFYDKTCFMQGVAKGKN